MTTIPVGSGYPCAAVINPLTNKIYVGKWLEFSVTVIDGASNSTTTVATGECPEALALNLMTNKIYVANDRGSSVTVIDGADNSTATVPVGHWPMAVAINPVTNKIYVVNEMGSDPANFGKSNISVINGADNSATFIEVGTHCSNLAVNPATNKVYVVNDGSKRLLIINGTNNNVATIPFQDGPYNVMVNSATNHVYVTWGSYLSILDGITDTIETTVQVGRWPVWMMNNPVSNKIYVGNRSDNTVSVIGEDEQDTGLHVSITPLPNNQTENPKPAFVLYVNSLTNRGRNVYFQIDSNQGTWGRAIYSPTFTNRRRFLAYTPQPLGKGMHTLYAFYVDGQDATSTNTGDQSSPFIGNIAAYAFLVQ
jgi:YVTN family beta-propeller protein